MLLFYYLETADNELVNDIFFITRDILGFLHFAVGLFAGHLQLVAARQLYVDDG